MAVEWKNKPKPDGEYSQSSFKNFNVTYKMTDVHDDVASGTELKLRVLLYKKVGTAWRRINDGSDNAGVEFKVK